MQVNPVTSTTSATNSTDTVSSPSQALTQNNFLQLMVTQMENQDPLDPQSDTQMASEMAQFTSLQQSSSMAGSLGMMQANGLIGSTVNVQVDSQTTDNGVVQGVVLQSGTPEILVNGAAYTLSQVVSVAPTAAAPAAANQGSTTQ